MEIIQIIELVSLATSGIVSFAADAAIEQWRTGRLHPSRPFDGTMIVSPCASCNWEYVAEPIYDEAQPSLAFNFSSDNKTGKRPDWISMFYRFRYTYIDMSSYSHMFLSIEIDTGDLSGIQMELKTYGEGFCNYDVWRKQLTNEKGRVSAFIDLREVSRNILKNLREICFVINEAHTRGQDVVGKFTIQELYFIK